MIAEYHLTSASQGTHRILPVLPEGAAQLMPPLDEYLPGSFDGCRDVRVTDRAQILHVATWLHRLDLSATYGAEIAASPWVEDYDMGPLLEYFLMPRLSNLTLQEGGPRKPTGHGGLSKGPPRREGLAPERDRVADPCSGQRAREREEEGY